MIRSFSDGEKEAARRISTIDLLEKRYGFTFKQKGRGYCCEQHDSLIINQDRRGWHWNSKGISGGDAISFLQKIENLTYPEALQSLIGGSTAYTQLPQTSVNVNKEQKHPFVLPEKFEGAHKRLFAYLCKTRHLDRLIVTELRSSEQIYEDNRHNAVFVGYDANGKAVSAVKRGTNQNVKFRGEVTGSDKHNTFNMLTCPNSKRIYVFESPIECISHATMVNMQQGSDTAYKGQNRLSLNGLSDLALDEYLKNNPQIKEIHLCLNNDFQAQKKDGSPDENHGQIAAGKIADKFGAKGYVCVNHLPPFKQNDWNDALAVMCSRQQKFQTVKPETAVFRK